MIFRVFSLIFLLVRYRCFFLVFPFLYNSESKSQAKRFIRFLERSGSTFIKLGQLLSTRVDFFSTCFIEELHTLKDQVASFDEIPLFDLIQKDLKKNPTDIFATIDNVPYSSASIANIYKAELVTGEKVAIKVLKPKIEKIVYQDIALLNILFKISEIFIKRAEIIKPTKIIKTLKEMVKKELDLRIEAASMDEFRSNFKNDQEIIVPKVYWNLVTKNILVEDWIDAIKMNDIVTMKRENLDMKKLMINFIRLFFLQVLRDGFFHGDIHQGNLFVTKDCKIVFIDFGMMGRIDLKLKFYLYELFSAFLNKDYYKAASIHFEAGWISNKFKVEDFALSCRAIVEKIMGVKQKDIAVGDLLAQLFTVSGNFEMVIQEDLLLLQKNLVYLEHIGREISPEDNMWIISKEVINRNVKDTIGYKDYAQKFIFDVKENVEGIKNIFSYHNVLLEKNIKESKKSNFKLLIMLLLLIIVILYKF